MERPVDLAALSRAELIGLVGQHLSRIEALEARIAELEGQRKPPTEVVKERKPPSWAKANRPSRPKKERKKRSHGFARRREEPTHRVEHATASCPDCQVPLTGGRVCGSRQVITLPRVRARVTEHVVLERACPECRKRWTPEPDWSAITAGRQRFGISVQSEVSVLREECRLPFRVIQRYLKWRFGLRLSVGELVALTRGAAEHGREEYDRLRQEIRASPVVYGDETGWRQDGRNGYLWSFSTPKVRYFLYRPGRGGTVVEEVLGDEFEGVLVSDFYGAYNVYQGPHQRCWSNCSELRGSEQPAAFQEGIEASGPPGAEEGCRAILLSVPCWERAPPLILRLVTRCRRLRSAALLSGGTAGSDTKTNSSLMNRSMRRQSLA